MKLFLILFLFFYLLPFFIISVVPVKDIILFNGIYISSFFVLIYFYYKYLYNKRFTLVAFSRFKKYLILVLLYFVILYVYILRWSIELHGMGDAYVLWSGKASVIANLYLQNDGINFSNLNWKFPSYPLALPLLLSGFTIINGNYNPLIPIIFTCICTLFFLFIIVTQSVHQKGKLGKIIFITLVCTMFLDRNYLFVHSDLCADYPLSILVAISCFLFLRRQRKYYYYYIGCTLAIMSSLKNEGVLISLVFIVILIIYKLNGEKLNLTSILIAYLIFFLPMIIYKLNFTLTPNDFKSNEGLLSKVIQKNPKILLNEFMTVSKYFIEFQFGFQKGILIFFSYFLMVYGDKKQKTLLAFYWLLVFIYSSIFLSTSLDIEKHLNSAYHRINVHMYPILFVALFYNIDVLRERIDEIISLTKYYRK